jgi:hypothetical protein
LDPVAADSKIQIIPFDKIVVFHLSIMSPNGTCSGTWTSFFVLFCRCEREGRFTEE